MIAGGWDEASSPRSAEQRDSEAAEMVSDQVTLPRSDQLAQVVKGPPAMEFGVAHAVGCVLEESDGRSLLWEHRERPGETDDDCKCLGETCSCRSTGFPSGIWMDDWAARLPDAAEEAHRVAERPFVGRMLEVLSRGEALPFATSELVNARLLDLAILIGNKDVADHLAKLCGSRPLRLWRSQDLIRWTDDGLRLWDPAVLSAALSAGVDLTQLRWKGRHGALPLREAAALAGCSNLGLLVPVTPSLTRTENRLGEYLMAGRALCFERLEKAVEAAVPVRHFRLSAGASCGPVGFAVYPTLLDMAIWCGQWHCAVLCASVGVEFKQEGGKKLLESPEAPWELWSFSIAPPMQRLVAGRAAGVAALQLSWRQAREKGVAQMGRPFPKVLVDEVLAYSMDVPRIIELLDLWDQIPDWHHRKGFAGCE